MEDLSNRLALHTWTLDTTPLADALRIARKTGWNAAEVRRSDFVRCLEDGMTNAEVIELIRSSGIKVAVLGTEYGLLFAKGAEQRRLLDVLAQTCANAGALGCDVIMTATGALSGSVAEAADNLRRAGDVVAAHGLRLAYEFSSAHETVNRLDIAREIIARTRHPACGLLLDVYHLERSGAAGRGFEDVPVEEIFAVQYSDVPDAPLPGGLRPADRLAPGQGVVRWDEVLGLLIEKGYRGYLSYEAPNPASWSRPPEVVAREAVVATRSLLSSARADAYFQQEDK
ncbi:MAG: sugar phosphate isomerase/epimerase [Betaproteobacteria bacterium]|nr:sugar phosphate isomerase/epimerase [Betaproteobacteria bacterium]